MALGRLLERLFVQVDADLSGMTSQLASGVKQTQTATNKMSMQWNSISRSIDNLAADMRKGIITQGQYMSQLNKHVSQIAALNGNYRQAQRQVFQYAASLKQVQAAAPVAFSTRPPQQFTRSVGMARNQMLNLGFQINDIGQTLATGMNPFTVMIQQGSQIIQIYAGQGGVNAALRDLSRILTAVTIKIWPLALATGAILGTMKALQLQTNIELDGNQQFEKLKDDISKLDEEAQKNIKTFVTFGDVVKATFQVIGRRIMAGPIGDSIRWLRDQWARLANALPTLIAKGMDFVVNNIRVAILRINHFVGGIADMFEKTFEQAKANVLLALAFILRQLDEALLDMNVALNKIPGVDLNFGFGLGIFHASENMRVLGEQAQAAADGIDTVSENIAKFRQEADRVMAETPVSDLFEEIKDQAVENALNRISDGISDVAEETKKLNDELDELVKTLEEELATAADNLAAVFGSAFEQLVETGKVTFKDFVMELNRLITQSVSKMLQQELSKMFQNLAQQQGGLGDLLANTFSAIFGGGTSGFEANQNANAGQSGGQNQNGGFFKAVGDFFTGLFSGGRARGGIEMPFRSFVAGEEGPELITQDGPAGARRVMTAGQTHAMMGNQRPIQVVMNISTPDVESFRQSQGQLASRATMFLERGRRNQ